MANLKSISEYMALEHHHNVERLFRSQQMRLRTYLNTYVGNQDTAADLVQETFLRFMEKSDGTRINSAISYLYRIAANLAMDHLRREKRHQTKRMVPEQLAYAVANTPQPDKVTDTREKIERLRSAVQELPALTRQVLVLCRLQFLTYAEVATKLGISESSVQKHLTKALQHIKQNVNPPRP